MSGDLKKSLMAGPKYVAVCFDEAQQSGGPSPKLVVATDMSSHQSLSPSRPIFRRLRFPLLSPNNNRFLSTGTGVHVLRWVEGEFLVVDSSCVSNDHLMVRMPSAASCEGASSDSISWREERESYRDRSRLKRVSR